MKGFKSMFHYSLWLSLITILIFPGRAKNMIGIKYGFPISFFTYYHQDRWFIKGVSVDILKYFINVSIIFVILFCIKEIYNKLTTRKRDAEIKRGIS